MTVNLDGVARLHAATEPAAPPIVSAPKSKAKGRTWKECRAEIRRRKDEPWVGIYIGPITIATVRAGSFIVLVAPSGAGKSSLVMQMLIDHANKRGPAILLTHELDGDEAVARGSGQLAGWSWESALRDEIPDTLLPDDVPRIRILERDDATMAALELQVSELKIEYPGEPILVAVDYLQGTPAPAGKERGHVAGISTELRRGAKRLGVVILGVSQSSTNNAKQLRSGDLIGIESASAGAETSQIERDAYVIMTLGNRRIVDPDTLRWSLSMAKMRLAGADLVYDLDYRGRVGDWFVVGQPKTATEVRETKDSEKLEKTIATIKGAIRDLLARAPKPLSKSDVTKEITGKNGHIAIAIKELVRDGDVVHVHHMKKGGSSPLWLSSRVAELPTGGD